MGCKNGGQTEEEKAGEKKKALIINYFTHIQPC